MRQLKMLAHSPLLTAFIEANGFLECTGCPIVRDARNTGVPSRSEWRQLQSVIFAHNERLLESYILPDFYKNGEAPFLSLIIGVFCACALFESVIRFCCRNWTVRYSFGQEV